MDQPLTCDLRALAAEIEVHGLPALVGVDGPGGAGKSTFASLLAAASAQPVAVVHGDDFSRPSGSRPAATAGHGSAFDLERLRTQVLAPFAAGSATTYQVYDWDDDELGAWVELPDSVRVLVVEGIYCTERSLRGLYTYRIFCTAPYEVRLARGLERDGAGAEGRWVREWMPAEDRYLRVQRPDLAAHLVLDGSGSGRPPAYSVVSARA